MDHPEPRTDHAITLLVTIGCVLRLTGLSVHSLWLDEGFSLHLATAADFWQQMAINTDPPLLYLLLRHWPGIQGPDEAIVRLLPAFASCASVLLFAWSSGMLLPQRARRPAVAAHCFSPFLVWYAQELRAYALVEAAGLLFLAGHLLLRRGASRWGSVLATVGSLLAAWLHYLGPLGCVGVLAMGAVHALQAKSWRAWIGTLVAAAVGWISVVPWLIAMLPAQLRHHWGAQAHLSLRDLAELPVRLQLVHVSELPLAVVILVAAASWLALSVIAIRAWRDPRGMGGQCLVLFAAPILAALALTLFTEPRFVPRYLIASASALNLVLGLAFAAVPWSRVRVGLALGGVVALVWVHVELRRQNLKDDYRGAAAHIAAHWQPGDAIAVVAEMPAGFADAALRFYLAGTPAGGAIVPADRFLAADAVRAATTYVLLRKGAYTALREREIRARLPVRTEATFGRVLELLQVR